MPIGRRYLEAQEQAAQGGRTREAVEASIYNHLYTFFSRYYDEGDFISKRRYSRNNRYAIPYNGEEVYLHWANSDQYYVKTDEHFRNYDWKAPNGVSVHFRLQERRRGAEQRQGRDGASSYPARRTRSGTRAIILSPFPSNTGP